MFTEVVEIEQGLEVLRRMAEAKTALDARIDIQVRSLRERGATWEQIGAAVGITKQGAYQRWGGVRRTPDAR